MNKKVYMTPAVEVMEMDCAPLLAGSITFVDGNAGLTLSEDSEIPGVADAPVFQDGDFDMFKE